MEVHPAACFPLSPVIAELKDGSAGKSMISGPAWDYSLRQGFCLLGCCDHLLL